MNQDQSVEKGREGAPLPKSQSEGLMGKASRFLFGNDVFISYARRDSTIYSLGLANELTKKQLACFLDQWGTPSGTKLPVELMSTLKRSNMLILLGTERAAASKAVELEIIEFKKTGRTIIPVSFDGALEKAEWYADLIAGISIAHESKEALESGKPSENVVSRIVNAENFTRRSKRLRNYFWMTAASVVLMLLVGALAGFLIVRQANAKVADAEVRLQNADLKVGDAEKKRQAAAAEAQEALDQQRVAEGKAVTAAKNAADATANAEKQQQLAAEQKKAADQQKRRADEQTRIADEQQQRSRQLTYVGNMPLAQQAFETGKMESGQRLLNAFLPGGVAEERKKDEDLRGFEWYHLWRSYHRKLLDVPLDGKDSGENSRDLRAGQYPDPEVTKAKWVAFSPLTKQFATTDNESLKLWDVTDPTSIKLITKFDGPFRKVGYSHDGKVLAAISDSKIYLWKTDTLSALAPIERPEGKHFLAIAFSPDGRLAAAHASGVDLWDISPDKISRPVGKVPSTQPVSSVAFSPDGEHLGIASLEVIEIWNIPSKAKVATVKPKGDYFTGSLFFLPDNRTAGIIDNSEFRLWDFKTQTEKSTFKISIGTQFIPDSWEHVTTAISPGGKFLITGARDPVTYGGGVKLWDISNGKLVATFDGVGIKGDVTSLAFSPDGEAVAIGGKEGVQFSDPAPSNAVTELQVAESRVKFMRLSADGSTLATISGEGSEQKPATLNFYNTRTGRLEHTRDGKGIDFIGFSPDGGKYATTTRTESEQRRRWIVELWDAHTHASLGPPLGETSESDLAFSADGQTLALGASDHETVWSTDPTYGCNESCVQFWNLVTGKKSTGIATPRKIQIPSIQVTPLMYSPNGKLLVFRNFMPEGNSIDLMDVATKRSLVNISDMDQSGFSSFAFSADSKTFAIARHNSTVSLWDVSSLYERKTRITDVLQGVDFWKMGDKHFIGLLEGHAESVNSVAFSPNGKTIATASNDGTVKLWDARFYQPLSILRGYKGAVSFVSFTADGRTLITSGDDKSGKGNSIKLWRAAAKEEVAFQSR